MNRRLGFTAIEIIVAIVVLMSIGGLFLFQKNHFQAAARDDRRKADINTIYHNLEKVYFKDEKSYPQELNETALPAIQPDTFKDPNGILVNSSRQSEVPGLPAEQSDYHYNPKDCDLEKKQCKSYELRAKLETEKDYVKTSAAVKK